MVNKKGDGDVDWVLSIGIFLIYLLGMFVIIKPGVEPVHNYNTLLDILKEKGKQDVRFEVYPDGIGDIDKFTDFGGFYWTLYKVPLFFKDNLGGNCIKIINFPYTIDNNKINVYKIDTSTGVRSPLYRRLSGNNLYIEETASTWDYSKEYVIFFSDNIVYDSSFANDESLFKDITVANLETDCIIDEEGTKFNLGISEATRGISERIMELLELGTNSKQPHYEKIKEFYGYPKSKEFSIVITKKDESPLEYKPVIPDVKTNVYTKEWGDFILNYDGTRIPAKVNIKVW